MIETEAFDPLRGLERNWRNITNGALVIYTSLSLSLSLASVSADDEITYASENQLGENCHLQPFSIFIFSAPIEYVNATGK